jgi:hypothetical protein
MALIISSGVFVYALRQNNLTMVRLRENVYQADKGDGNIQSALKQLQAYVVSNMNTSLTEGNGSVYPPIQLTYTYDRLEQAALNQSQAANTQIYTDAEYYCQKLDPTDFSGHNRVPCVEQYVQSHGINAPTVPTSLYEFDFISPSWSPDLAGWSLVAGVLLLLTLVVLVITDRWFKKHVE